MDRRQTLVTQRDAPPVAGLTRHTTVLPAVTRWVDGKLGAGLPPPTGTAPDPGPPNLKIKILEKCCEALKREC